MTALGVGSKAVDDQISSVLPAELSVIVPTRNECGNVHILIRNLIAALAGICWEVIFVDDDSPDGTIAAVKLVAEHDPRVRGIRRINRRGLAGAVIEGILASSAPIVAVMDGDMQHDPQLLPRMFEVLKEKEMDLVVATREQGVDGISGLSPMRQRMSAFATALARLVSRFSLGDPLTLRDPMSGFFMVRREIVEQVAPRLSGEGFKILMDLVLSVRKPLRTYEYPYEFRKRHAGTSKLDSWVALDYVALLVAKLLGDGIPIRFILFGLVGLSGLGLHLGMLRLLLATGVIFSKAQLGATLSAMVWNYLLNNTLTYRDRRRKGWRLLSGLISFMALCSVGVVANIGLASLLYRWNRQWLIAGVAGALIGSVWNYAATSAVTWR